MALEDEDFPDDVGAPADGEDDGPDMMELIDQAEAAKDDVEAFAAALRAIGHRARTVDGDRETLTDFDGVAQICRALAEPTHGWAGPAMVAFCKIMPDVCKKSAVNRGSLRDEGAVVAVVDFLRRSGSSCDEAGATAACIALCAMCTANDGSKKAAARLRGEFNEEELAATGGNDPTVPLFMDPDAPGALDLLLDALRRFPDSAALQTHALSAFRCLISDDDPRQPTCLPSAVENRDRMIDEKVFPEVFGLVVKALELEAAASQPAPRLREHAMLVLKELACREDRIRDMTSSAGLLPRVEASLGDGDERVVRACMALIRAFGFSDDLKERLAVDSDVALRCIAAVRRHTGCPPICEQAFGLFANVTMRKPHIATRLASPDYQIMAVAQVVLVKYRENPNVSRSVIQTLRNIATQVDDFAVAVRESDVFEELRTMIVEHAADEKWRSPVEIAKQFLREFREDEGIRRKAEYNDYY